MQEMQNITSMGHKDFRGGMPEWIRQLPIIRLKYRDFQLIEPDELEKMLEDVSEETKTRILEDIETLDKELLWMFRERDYQAKEQQNRYRSLQIGFMLLASLATLIGALQAVTLDAFPTWLPWFAFGETIVALFTTFIATVQGNRPPMQLWLMNRRRAEYLRREYFRYLADVPPYDKLQDSDRRRMLARRAADINRGVDPEDAG
ncbi:MAG: DUF4231 domain-containing protein [Anaerolineae bacterium]|nr:DUF4231 domain-containing protein [Anaerolineae bacterium]MDQ7033533.1 DUF4231 domain-containing protein [Anaerolineae bacterium]